MNKVNYEIIYPVGPMHRNNCEPLNSMLLLPELCYDPFEATGNSLREARALLLLPHAEEPVRKDRHKNLENNEDPHEAEVTPALRIVDVRSREELVGYAERAVLALGRRSRVLDRAACLSCVRTKILLARLTGGWWEDAEFCLRALDLSAC